MLRLELIDISKQYPAVKANDRVNLRVKPGEIHAVLGENGAGKSTMMKMIYGAVRPDEGEIRWNGQAVQIASPAQARALGISMVYQHFSLFDTLTAAERLLLSEGFGQERPGGLAGVATRHAIASYHYRAGRLGLVHRRAALPADYGRTRLGAWIEQTLKIPIVSENRSAIGQVFQILAAEASWV